MARGRDERGNPKRKPLIIRDLNSPNTLWVNFSNPTEPHEEVVKYLTEQRRARSRSMHPSNQPKEEKPNE